jgi:hypothetical protein
MAWFGKIGLKRASLDDFRRRVDRSRRRCVSLVKIKSQDSQILKRRLENKLVLST